MVGLDRHYIVGLCLATASAIWAIAVKDGLCDHAGPGVGGVH